MKYDITIQQGATFNISLIYKDSTGNVINLTGSNARMDIRTQYTAPQALIRLSDDNGRISIDGANGQITLMIDAANTSNLPASNCVYDLEIVTGNTVTRLLEGKAQITPQVTK